MSLSSILIGLIMFSKSSGVLDLRNSPFFFNDVSYEKVEILDRLSINLSNIGVSLLVIHFSNIKKSSNTIISFQKDLVSI
jgi:hypothetical protein